MPTYRGVSVELHSQFDIETFPEIHPREQSYYDRRGIAYDAPLFTDERSSTCNVYVPVFAGSQFWICYQVDPPIPDSQYFVFKLFIDGSQIVNWSCGKQQRWRGKTMFGLFELPEGEGDDGKKRIEKRVFRFSAADQGGPVVGAFDQNAYMEIRVHRARGRKRIAREVEPYVSTPHSKGVSGIDLVNAGRAGSEQPKRLYKYALIDPVDAPHVVFRYHYRTWEQMDHLGLFTNIESDTTLLPLGNESGFDKSVAGGEGKGATKTELRGGELEDIFADVTLTDDDRTKGERDFSLAESTTSTDTFESAQSMLSDGGGDSKSDKRQYRLSIPPSLKLTPPEGGRPLPAIPQKQELRQAHSYTEHPVYRVDEWEARTPSPVRSIRDGISTPPLGRRSGLTAATLIDVVASAWKRRGTPTSEHSNDAGSRSGSRSRDAS